MPDEIASIDLLEDEISFVVATKEREFILMGKQHRKAEADAEDAAVKAVTDNKDKVPQWMKGSPDVRPAASMKKRTKDIDLDNPDGEPGSLSQLSKLHAKWGKSAGITESRTEHLNDEDRNKLYEFDQRGGPFFKEKDDDSIQIEIKVPKRKRSVGNY